MCQNLGEISFLVCLHTHRHTSLSMFPSLALCFILLLSLRSFPSLSTLPFSSPSSSFFFLLLPPPFSPLLPSLQPPLYLSVAALFRLFISQDKALPAAEFVFFPPALPLSSVWMPCMCSGMGRETETEREREERDSIPMSGQ